MIRTFRIAVIVISLTIMTTSSNAQPYQTGIGARFGGITSGLTVKHFTEMNSAVEGILSFGQHSFLITGLYEKHNPFAKVEGLNWFFGGGAHIGFFNDHYGGGYYYYKYKGNKVIVVEDAESDVSFGVDFILGMEYKIKNAPVSLSFDLKPFIDFVPGVYGYWEGAFTFRFTL